MDTTDNIKKHYAKNFDPEGYRKRLVYRDGSKLRKEEEFFFKSMHEIFQDPAFRGTTLLDIGSGPTVHNISSASAFFSHIVLSDFVDANREELEKWLKDDKDALDWTRLLTEAAKAEGFKDLDEGRRILTDRIRKSVKDVIHCDVLADPIVPKEFNKEYDVVMTSLTLEAAAPDYKTFKDCLRKIHSLVSPGGKLVLKGFLNGGPWSTGEHEFPYLKLTVDDISKALEEAGFCDIRWKSMKRSDTEYAYQFDGCYCLSCFKPGT